MPSLSILLKPASCACNLHCDYCFYADEAKSRTISDYGMMSRAVSHALIDRAAGAAQGMVAFLFQGGEPTLAGLDFYRDFVSYAQATIPCGLTVQYALQTNGILLDEAWCRFFKENDFLVGLSLDGSRKCHDRFRRDRAGEGTYEQVLGAARLLDGAGVSYNVLTVVTGYLAGHVRSVFSNLCGNGFCFQQYIPCLDPLEGKRGQQEYSLSPKQYEEFLKTLFDLWYQELANGRYWSVRYFDNLVWMLDGHAPEQCSMRGCCGLQYLVEADGSVYPCDFYGLDEYRMGHVLCHSWQELDQARRSLRFIENSQVAPQECQICRWYPLCRNGCRRERLAQGAAPGKNYYCQAYAGFFAYALPRLYQVRRMLRT